VNIEHRWHQHAVMNECYCTLIYSRCCTRSTGSSEGSMDDGTPTSRITSFWKVYFIQIWCNQTLYANQKSMHLWNCTHNLPTL